MGEQNWPRVVGVKDEAVEPWIALQRKLAQIDRVPCTEDPDLWFSEDADERDLAARACLNCLAIEVCGRYAEANDERMGVWAGVDRTVSRGRPAKRDGSAA